MECVHYRDSEIGQDREEVVLPIFTWIAALLLGSLVGEGSVQVYPAVMATVRSCDSHMMSCDPTIISGGGSVDVLSLSVSQEGEEEGLRGVWSDDTGLDQVIGMGNWVWLPRPLV